MRVTASRTFAAFSAATLLVTVAACGSSTSNAGSTSSTPSSSAASSVESSVASSESAGSSVASSSDTGSSSASSSTGSSPTGSAAAGADAPTKNPATDGKTINVLMVNNSQMLDLQKLTAAEFTAKTGITVKYTVLEEGAMRDKASVDFKAQSDQYDVATLSNFEIPIWSKNNWLADLTDYSKNDASFNQADIFPAFTNSLTTDGKLYGEPFYGESSFLMYRKDILDSKGITMPENPTWDQVADAAAKVDGAQPGMKGICLRGKPGWGDSGAPFTTVVNTFGGTWWDKDWNEKVDDQPFKDAANFYANLVKEHGEVSPDTTSFNECLSNVQQNKVAMWYDATSGAGKLEAADSPVKGKMAYVQAPVKLTKSSGWLYAWSWGIQAASKEKDAAWQFVSWASSTGYENTVGTKLGWANAPGGKRASLYSNPEYTKAAAAFAPATLKALNAADPANPGVQPRPTVGIQFVDVDDFRAFGDDVMGGFADVLKGTSSVDDWISATKDKAQELGDNQK